MVEATRDSLLGGTLVLWQPAKGHGYRFSLDPVLLAGFAPEAPRAVDLGAGCGVVGLLLLARGKTEHVIAVERQRELADLALRNARDNGLDARMDVRCGDLRETPVAPAELVVFNPPYFAGGNFRGAGHPGRDAARHERHGTLGDFVARAASTLAPGGALCTIVRAERHDELTRLFGEHALAPTRLRPVHPRPGLPPRHVLVEARAERTGPVQTEPLIVHRPDGRHYSDEVRSWLEA